MANAVRVRIELKKKYNDPEKNFKELFHEFKKRVNAAGVLHTLKEHQSYESRSRKARRKKVEAGKRSQMEAIEEKLKKGERVKAPAGLIKKILANQKKEKEKEKKKKTRDFENNF